MNQLQQQVLNIQNSIMQLHGKVDGLGMQLTTSSSMQMGINPMGLNSNNMGMGMGLIPVVGAPLPFVSYGGTIMASMMIGFGLVLNIDLHKNSDLKLN